jgi:hypothetical protein
VVAPLLFTKIVAPHLRHLILTVLPWTLSSETVYFDWQELQVIFMSRVARRVDGGSYPRWAIECISTAPISDTS